MTKKFKQPKQTKQTDKKSDVLAREKIQKKLEAIRLRSVSTRRPQDLIVDEPLVTPQKNQK